MKKKKELLRAGILGVLALFLLRLIFSMVLGGTVSLFSQPELASFLISQESGRQPAATTAPTQPSVTDPMETEPSTEITEPSTGSTEPSTEETEPSSEPTDPSTEPTQPDVHIPSNKPEFTAEDMEYFGVNYNCVLKPNLEKLLTQTLSWDLTGDKPTILIIHTHGTEAYTPTADTQYEEYGGEYRTDDDRYNLISIGDELTRLLEQKGLNVIHDRTPYDKDDYLDAYDNSRAAVKKWLEEYPSIKMVLDLHRDAAENEDGTQWATTTTVNGESTARIMMVVGSSAGGLNHPNWEQNMALAEKLSVLMNRTYGNVARYINFRAKRFNQDLSTGALIVEVGAAGNTHQQAINAMPVLAEAIYALAKGSK